MNMKNRSARLRFPGEGSFPGTPDDRGQTAMMRQKVWERAQRLYAIGELNLAARLLSELAAGGQPNRAEAGREAVNG